MGRSCSPACNPAASDRRLDARYSIWRQARTLTNLSRAGDRRVGSRSVDRASGCRSAEGLASKMQFLSLDVVRVDLVLGRTGRSAVKWYTGYCHMPCQLLAVAGQFDWRAEDDTRQGDAVAASL